MVQEAKKTRRPRRTKQAVEKDVMNAVASLIEEVGFTNVTLTGVAQRAQIEASVFYRRYENLEELFDVYVRKYDYWLSGISDLLPSDLSDADTFKWIMRNLTLALYKNKGMQQLLIWELAEDNYVTRRTAQMREKLKESLIRLLESRFEYSGFDINVICSLMISGIYYLVLHRNISTFCDVDFSTKKGKERLELALDQMVDILFHEKDRRKKDAELAANLRAEGVSEDIIRKYIDVPGK